MLKNYLNQGSKRCLNHGSKRFLNQGSRRYINQGSKKCQVVLVHGTQFMHKFMHLFCMS